MDFLLLLLLLLVASSIVLVMLKDIKFYDITTKNKYTKDLSKISIGLYVLFGVAVSFYTYQSILNSLETMGFYFLFGFLVKIIWSMLVGKKDLKIWFKIWAIICGITGVIEMMVYKNQSIIDNVVEFGVILILCFLVLTIISILKRNEYGPLLIKILFISYSVISLLFGFIPPFDLGVAIATWIILVIPGLIFGGILLFFYRRRFSPIDEITELSGYHESNKNL